MINCWKYSRVRLCKVILKKEDMNESDKSSSVCWNKSNVKAVSSVERVLAAPHLVGCDVTATSSPDTDRSTWGCTHRAKLTSIKQFMSHKAHFLLPVGGAMSMTPRWHVGVFRVGLLANVTFGPDWTMYTEITTTTSSFMANNGLPRKHNWKTHNVNNKALSRCYGCSDQMRCINLVKISTWNYRNRFPVASRWRCDCHWILACRCVQGGTLIHCVKFGADWTMFSGVINNFLFHATPFQVTTNLWKRLEVDRMNLPGGVH